MYSFQKLPLEFNFIKLQSNHFLKWENSVAGTFYTGWQMLVKTVKVIEIYKDWRNYHKSDKTGKLWQLTIICLNLEQKLKNWWYQINSREVILMYQCWFLSFIVLSRYYKQLSKGRTDMEYGLSESSLHYSCNCSKIIPKF